MKCLQQYSSSLNIHVQLQPSVCLLGTKRRAALYNWQSFPVGWLYRRVIFLHSNLWVAQSWLVNFPLHYRSSNRLISLRRVAPIIVFYLFFRSQFTCASLRSVKETQEGKMKMLLLFTSTHHPLMTWHMERKKQYEFGSPFCCILLWGIWYSMWNWAENLIGNYGNEKNGGKQAERSIGCIQQ